MMEEIARLPSDIAKAAARSLENIRVPNLTICNANKRNPTLHRTPYSILYSSESERGDSRSGMNI
jgi:hypothetical protein